MESINERIKRLRLEHGWTQTDLAQKLGYVDKSSITKLEKGQGDLTQTKLKQLSEVFNVSISYLLDGEETSLYMEFEKMSDEDKKTFLDRVEGYMANFFVKPITNNEYPITMEVTRDEQKLIKELREHRELNPRELEIMFNKILKHKVKNDTLSNPIDTDEIMHYEIRVKQFLGE